MGYCRYYFHLDYVSDIPVGRVKSHKNRWCMLFYLAFFNEYHCLAYIKIDWRVIGLHLLNGQKQHANGNIFANLGDSLVGGYTTVMADFNIYLC